MKKYYPKISIVTPVFNQANYIEQTILSVLEQNYPNLEYIIIDGGSNDGTVDIIKKYEKYLTYWISEPDQGHAHALNKGFAKTTGQIMAWINGDDMYLPWAFKTVAQIFDQFPQINWLQGAPMVIDKYNRFYTAYFIKINQVDYLIGRYEWIQQESVFWRRQLWEKAGGYINQDFKFMVDGELWSRFFKYENLYFTTYPLAGYRLHPQNRAYLNISQVHNEMQVIIQNFRNYYKRDWKYLKSFLRTKKFVKHFPLLPRLLPLLKKQLLQKISLPFYYQIITSDRESNLVIRKEEINL